MQKSLQQFLVAKTINSSPNFSSRENNIVSRREYIFRNQKVLLFQLFEFVFQNRKLKTQKAELNKCREIAHR